LAERYKKANVAAKKNKIKKASFNQTKTVVATKIIQ